MGGTIRDGTPARAPPQTPCQPAARTAERSPPATELARVVLYVQRWQQLREPTRLADTSSRTGCPRTAMLPAPARRALVACWEVAGNPMQAATSIQSIALPALATNIRACSTRSRNGGRCVVMAGRNGPACVHGLPARGPARGGCMDGGAEMRPGIIRDGRFMASGNRRRKRVGTMPAQVAAIVRPVPG